MSGERKHRALAFFHFWEEYDGYALAFIALAGVAAALFVWDGGGMGFVTLVGAVAALAVLQKPFAAVAFLLLFVPFSEMELFAQHIVDVPGGKAFNILGAVVATIAVVNLRQRAEVRPAARWFFALYLALFTVALVRSLGKVDLNTIADEESLSTQRYILTYYVKPLIYLIPCLMAVWFVRSRKDFRFVASVLALALTLLSGYIVYQLLVVRGGTIDIRMVDDFYRMQLGQHRNDLINLFICGFPILMARFFIRKGLWVMVALALSVLAIAYLFSRTGYAVILLGILLYLFLSRRTKWIPVVSVVGLIGLFFVADIVIDRAMAGLEEGDRNIIFAGRVDYLWLPLIEELGRHPAGLLVGNGLHAITYSESMNKGLILPTGHPHNMYLEQVLNGGLLSLLVTVGFIGMLLIRLVGASRRETSPELREYLCGLAVGIACYLVAGLTGRTLFPAPSNSYFWLLVGLSTAILRMRSEGGDARE